MVLINFLHFDLIHHFVSLFSRTRIPSSFVYIRRFSSAGHLQKHGKCCHDDKREHDGALCNACGCDATGGAHGRLRCPDGRRRRRFRGRWNRRGRTGNRQRWRGRRWRVGSCRGLRRRGRRSLSHIGLRIIAARHLYHAIDTLQL